MTTTLRLDDTKWDFVIVTGNEQIATHCPDFEAVIEFAELDIELKNSKTTIEQCQIIPKLRGVLKKFVSDSQHRVIDGMNTDDVFQSFLACGNYWQEHIKKKVTAAEEAIRPTSPKTDAETPKDKSKAQD